VPSEFRESEGYKKELRGQISGIVIDRTKAPRGSIGSTRRKRRSSVQMKKDVAR